VPSGSVAEERKLVSVLFVDVVGSTARADGADPEDVRDQNQAFFDETRDRIQRHGGVVEKYVGDAVMAVFGAPLAQGDDAERAVRAALSVLEGIDALNRREPGLDLHARVAVCTGEAVVAIEPAPGDALATGDIVNTAARLQSAAPPGRVVVGAETHRLTRHTFGFEQLPAVHAKGKREPVDAWLVAGTLLAPAERPTSTTPLVGRDRELLLFRTVWDRAVSAGAPHLLSVIGPAGIGKSRLAREAAAIVEADGGTALWGRSLPYEEQTPYRAFGQIIRRAAGIYENDGVEVARDKVAALVGSLFPADAAAEATRYLSLLLGLGLDTRADEPIHLLFAARRLVELLADRAPLLLVFEDVHWADEPLLDLLAYLTSRIRDHAVVFLALARPEFLEARPTWGSGLIGQTTLPLDPLAPDDAAQVVTVLSAGVPPSTRAKVVETAEGNPLFLEELVAALADDGEAAELPATVRAAIAARIDTLPRSPRTSLLHASVIGQTFWRGVLSEIGGIEDVDLALDALEGRGLIQRHPQSQVEGDVEFSFKHVLVRDVAYGTLSRTVRRELHAATARVVEASVPDPQELSWILAVHWREGGEPARAMEYLLAAGDRALDALAVEQTYDLYSRALELAATDEDRRRIRLRRGVALAHLEDFDRADRELAELIPELDGRDEVEALLARGMSTFWTEQMEETLRIAQRAAELSQERGLTELEPPSVGLVGATYGMRGEEGDLERAIELSGRALESWVPGTRLIELAELYHMQADHFYWSGRYPEALEMALASATTGGLEPHSAEFLLRGAGMEGLILAGMGRYQEAIAAGDEAIAAARRLGRGDNVVMNYSTLALREIFALDEAAARSELVADRLGPSHFNMPWMNARADVIGVHLMQGDVAGVERDWPGAWDDAVGSVAWERWLISGRLASIRAETELERSRFDEAVAWARRAVEMARASQRPKYEMIALMTLGRSLVADHAPDDGITQLRAAVAMSDRLGSPLYRWQARAALGSALRDRADTGAEGENLLRDAGAIAHQIAASLAPERAGRYLAARQVAGVLDALG
jgi:class 3 adenylate cyclase/tetratricopeptide (TPR) repeat protein